MATVRKILTIVLFVLMLIVMVIGLVSCDCDNASYNQTQVKKNENTGEVTYTIRGVELHVVEIDGCEYLIGIGQAGYAGYGFLTHKGNCKYCEERRRNNE